MKQKSKYAIKIGGLDYSLVSDEPYEYVIKIADFVNEKVEKLKKQSTKMSNQMALALACINITDEYFKVKKTEDELIRNVVEYTDKIEKLELELAALKEKYN
ncbi:MAG: cell division protein ZapA [Ruminococcaceae bacterium]|nr:cell division protein ZapA [Oscillospiraceae bacterium]